MEIFSNEINMRLAQEMDSLMAMMHSQINRAISSAITERAIPEIQNVMGSRSSGQRDTETGTSVNNQDSSEDTNVVKTKLTKKDSRSAFDPRNTGDLNPYTYIRSPSTCLKHSLRQLHRKYIHVLKNSL